MSASIAAPSTSCPNVRDHVEASLAGVSESDQRKVLYQNAARLYQRPDPDSIGSVPAASPR